MLNSSAPTTEQPPAPELAAAPSRPSAHAANATQRFTRFSEKKLLILQEISSAILLTDNINAIAHLLLDLAATHTLATKGSIFLLNSQEELVTIASRGVDCELARNYRVCLGQGVAGSIAEKRVPVLVADIDKDPRFKGLRQDHYKSRSFISCPIVARNSLLGLININDRGDGMPFSEQDFILIQIIANQAAVAFKNAQLVSQLKTKAFELEEVNRKLIESDLAKTEFLTRISHELRTPLNSASGAIYYLRQAPEICADERREFMGILAEEMARMASIVEGQLNFLRQETESARVRKTIIRLDEVIGEATGSRQLKDSLGRRNLSLSVDIPADLPAIAGDRVLAVQLFIHLVEGLALHLRKKSRVRIWALEKQFITVGIETSQTLPDWIISQLFNAKTFFRSDQSDGVLKLYLARRNADSHGWRLSAENQPDRFIVYLEIPQDHQLKAEAALSTALGLYLEFVAEILDLNTCSIMLIDELSGDLFIKSARGLEEAIVKKTRIAMGERIAGWVAQEGKPLLVDNVDADPRFSRRVGSGFYNSTSLLSLPLISQGRVMGVLNLNNKKSCQAFDRRDLMLMTVISERLAHLIERIRQSDELDKELEQLPASFENLLVAGRKYQKNTPLAPMLMERLMDRLDPGHALMSDALCAASLYDLGLMLIADNVLNKKKNLSASETSSIQTHPVTTLDLLADIEPSARIRRAILHHHERWDGAGYPDGLKGEEIPLLARVLAVLDAYIAMTEERPYRNALSHEETVAEIRREKGTKFDPAVVEALEAVFST